MALASLGLHLLAILQTSADSHAPPPRAATVVQEAERLILSRFHEPLDMRQIARELSVSYSYLRQHFRAQTGLSLKQYQLQVRLQRAQDLLANTDRPIKEVADMLGFDSAYHLSAQFKLRTGRSPRFWRRQFKGSAVPPL